MPAAMTMMTILQCSGMCYTSQDDKGKSIGSPFHSPSKDVQIMKCQTLFAVMIVLTLAGLSVAAEKAKTPAKEQGIVHTVTASMDYPTAGGVGIQAEKRPGEFKIPKGSKGAKLKYQFFNPKSGNTLTKLTGNSIYSVTEKRYMHELDKNPDFELPPGDYKFVVGGEPGATGTLTYTTVPSSDTNLPPKPPKNKVPGTDIPRNGKISLVLSGPDAPGIKLHWDFDINGGVVVGRGECTGAPTSHIQNYHADYHFKGTVTGKSIRGTASEEISWESKGGSTKTKYEGKGEVEFTLRQDHTVVGSEVHSGTTNGEPSVNDQKRVWIGTWLMSQKPAKP